MNRRCLGDLSHAEVLSNVGLGSSVDRSSALGRDILVATGEVVHHLSVELLDGLGLTTARVTTLATLGAASLTLGSFVGACVGVGVGVGVVLLVSSTTCLGSGGRLGLGLLVTIRQLA